MLSEPSPRVYVVQAAYLICLQQISVLLSAKGHFCFVVIFCPRLERLELGLCGRGFGDAAAAALAAGRPLTRLRSLALVGAYRLTDADLEHILAAAPILEELHLPQCSRLQDASALPLSVPQLR